MIAYILPQRLNISTGEMSPVAERLPSSQHIVVPCPCHQSGGGAAPEAGVFRSPLQERIKVEKLMRPRAKLGVARQKGGESQPVRTFRLCCKNCV